jgi:hypothetical protein
MLTSDHLFAFFQVITVQEPRTVQVPRQVPITQTVMQTRIVQQPKIVEYERPRMIPGKIVRSYNSGAVQTLGVTAVQPMPVQTQSYGMVTQPMGYATQGYGYAQGYTTQGQYGGAMQGSVPPVPSAGAQV